MGKIHPAERYYEPNFPVIREDEAEQLCDELALKVANLFKGNRRELERAFHATPLAERGWDFADAAQCVFARIQHGARGPLEKEGTLALAKAHKTGWIGCLGGAAKGRCEKVKKPCAVLSTGASQSYGKCQYRDRLLEFQPLKPV